MTRPFIMAAPNGQSRGKADHPALPVTIPETVATAVACKAAGADALHLHVRDAQGRHTLDTGLYREALAELDRTLPGYPVQITTEAGSLYSPADQLVLVQDLAPRWISLSVREAMRDAARAGDLYATCRELGVEVQHILYDAEDAARLRRLIDAGHIPPTPSVILVLGRYTGAPSDPADLPPLRASLPPVSKWMLCAFGPTEHLCLRQAARLGGDVRIGFENSFLQPDDTPWPDMAASVTAFVSQLG